MSETEQFNPRQEAVLDGLSLMARLYWGPDPELCGDLLDPALGELLAELGEFLPQAAATLRSLGAFLASANTPAELCDQLEPSYVELFLTRPEGAPAPLYHSCYVEPGRVMGPPAGHMAQLLEAEGLALEEKPGEPPDHLAVELEYLIFLLEEGWSGRREGWQTPAAEFSGRFMLPWVEEFAARQEGASECPFYHLAGKLLTALLGDVAQNPTPGV